jgi:hypothetical protein
MMEDFVRRPAGRLIVPTRMDRMLAGERLARGAALVHILFEAHADEVVRRRPAPGQWSLLEIVNHLADEEVLDFRARVQSTLEDPRRPWDPTAPEEWVVAHGYATRDPAESLARFMAERQRTCDWLRAAKNAAWDNVHHHPRGGPLSLRMLLGIWVAHDLLHVRQMLRVLHAQTAALIAPDTLDYAGKW